MRSGLCMCGHREDEHKWQAAECGHTACGCNVFRVGLLASLPKKKYVVVESEDSYLVYAKEGDESFT